MVRCSGLEQQIALPRDSYLQPYFSDVASVLRVGPPLFLVVEDLNMSRSATDVNRICSVSGCDDRSLMNQVRVQPRLYVKCSCKGRILFNVGIN